MASRILGFDRGFSAREGGRCGISMGCPALLFALALLIFGNCSPLTGASASPVGVELTVQAQEDSWVQVKVDGRSAYDTIMKPGQTLTWRGRKSIYFRTGNAGGVILTVNGRKLAPLGGSGEVRSRTFKPAPPPAPPKPQQPKPKPKLKPPPAAPADKRKPPLVEPASAVMENLPEMVTYASLAVLGILLLLCIWMLVVLRRENRLLTVLTGIAGREVSIKILASQRLSRGRTVYIVDVDGDRYLVGTGGVTLLTEISTQGRKE